jgi:copper(I)-binding protein
VKRIVGLLGMLLITLAAQAAQQVELNRAWARATAPGQEVGAAYLELKSVSDLTLVKVESPVAGSVEIHKMTMKNGVMEMRMLETLELPAGQVVKLEPGGFHFMLFDLKQPLKTGESVPLTLNFKDKTGKASTLKVELPVKRSAD